MKTKKFLSMLILLALLAVALVACAPAAEPAPAPEPAAEEPAPAPAVEEVEEEKEPVTLTLYTEYNAPPRTDLVDYWIETFVAKYPWITVEHRGLDNEVYEETLRIALLGQEPPDIFQAESRGEMVEFVEEDVVLDVTDFYDSIRDRFIPAFDALSDWQSVVGGRRYAIPYTVLHINLIWYNDALLQANGIDATTIENLEDLMEVCETLKNNGEVCFQLGAGSTWPVGHWAQFFIQQNLPEETWFKLATGEKSWTDEDIVDAVSYLEEMYKAGYFQAGVAADTRDVARAAYYAGSGAFYAAGSWALYDKASLAPPDWEFNFIPFPSAEDSPVGNPVLSTNNILYAVAKKSSHPEEALLFIDHITSLDAAQKSVELLQGFVTIKDAVTVENAGPEMVAIDKWASAGKGINWLENYFTREVISEGLWGGAVGVVSGQATTAEWMQLIADIQASTGNLEFE